VGAQKIKQTSENWQNLKKCCDEAPDPKTLLAHLHGDINLLYINHYLKDYGCA